ncbi:hypothetical protein Pyrde_1415 [Pyrodictium delaneyi]|uniref:Uncharacterized protein n=1 Tax=Pyrodictium delaneyi TaxID=1273541 RepID=A0A0P0N5F9_9CREN|nr:hypothetical protein [Pyrodictium delaneyi]ALL01461.1 hypothetical protein Pyrde_1415 [Pyrodictium delaneyi]OWJ54626.1 hypothetical protein Pdsh_06290 [Pyrodictium delaneyi]
MAGSIDGLLEKLRGLGLEAAPEDGRLRIRGGRGFSLADLPRELLEELKTFEEIVVEAPEGYYFYFRRKDVEKLLEIKNG